MQLNKDFREQKNDITGLLIISYVNILTEIKVKILSFPYQYVLNSVKLPHVKIT